jgi:nicotinamidase-related amidase
MTPISYFGMSDRSFRRPGRSAFRLFTSSTVPVPAKYSREERAAGRSSSLSPEGSEPVVRKRAADAFGETDLHARLQQIGARRLVVAGIQTEHCVAATCRAALQLGYEVYLAEDGHSTWTDQVRSARQIMTAESEMLKAAGVTLCSTEDLLNLLRSWRVTDP